MTSPERIYQQLKSNTSSPQRAGLKVSAQNIIGKVQGVVRVQTGQIILNSDWMQQLDILKNPKQGKNRVIEVVEHILKIPDRNASLTISFDCFGISDSKEYMNKNSVNLNQTLKIFKRINKQRTLEDIRKMLAQKTIDPQIKHLKFFKFSFINWKDVTPEVQLDFIQKHALTQRICINLDGTVLTANTLKCIKKFLMNNIGECQQIEINLSNCLKANSEMLSSLMTVKSAHSPQILKLRFINWGKDLQTYFGKKESPDNFKKEIKQTYEAIDNLRKQFINGRTQVTLDFRGWHEDFKLKEIEEANNKDKENVQSLGTFSKKHGNHPKYNIMFLS